MAVASKFGPTAADMTDSGETGWQTGMEDLCMLKVMFMKANGLMTKLMVLGFTLTLMGAGMKANGI